MRQDLAALPLACALSLSLAVAGVNLVAAPYTGLGPPGTSGTRGDRLAKDQSRFVSRPYPPNIVAEASHGVTTQSYRLDPPAEKPKQKSKHRHRKRSRHASSH